MIRRLSAWLSHQPGKMHWMTFVPELSVGRGPRMEIVIDRTEPVELAQRLDELHQLLYTRGGIRPSNAAVEELAKLLLIRIAARRHPDLVISHRRLIEVIEPDAVHQMDSPQILKEAFTVVNGLPDLGGRVPGGATQSVWPADEPLRVTRCDVLAAALRILETIPMDGEGSIDAVGTAFDVFLRGRYEHAGGLGTYLTPDSVVRAMTRIAFDLVEPFEGRLGDTPIMGDPCCGSGRFLVGMLEEARARGTLSDVLLCGDSVFGADQSSAAVAMARVNLLAYGMTHPEVFTVADSIVDRSLDRLCGTLRLILTNPPFGDGKYDDPQGIASTAEWFPGLVSKQRIDPAVAFVARCLNLLAPGGVAGIILPDGVADGPHMRTLLLGEPRPLHDVRLEGIVSLPSTTFAPAGTMAKTSVVFLRKAVRQENRNVFLARADHVGHVMRKGVVAPDPDGDDLPSVAASIIGAISGTPLSEKRGHVVTVDTRLVTSLDASSLDAEALAARTRLSEGGGVEFSSFLRPAKKRRTGVRRDVPFISVLHVDELGNVNWVEASCYRPTTPGLLVQPGQLIVSLLNPAKFRATVIPDDAPELQCSSEFGVFESTMDPYAVLALLQHPLVRAQIAPLGRGTSSSRRRVDREEVLRLVAPQFDDDWLDKVARVVADSLTVVAEARAKLTSAYGLSSDYNSDSPACSSSSISSI